MANNRASLQPGGTSSASSPMDSRVDEAMSHDVSEKKPLRVLVVSAQFLPVMGGVETHVNEVSRRIVRGGDIEITVLTTDRLTDGLIEEQWDGFKVLRCRAYPKSRDYFISPAIMKHIRRGRYDLIHCQGIHTAVPAIAMLAARLTGIPYMVSLHTGGHSSGMRNGMRRLQWRLLAPLLRQAQAIVALSRFEQRLFEEACHLDPAIFTIIQNGGDLAFEGPMPERVPARIVSSGRLERYKGHHRVIEALPIVRRTVPDATLKILGAGPYGDTLYALAKALGMEDYVKIESIAPSNRSDMAQSLAEASVFAALSEYEAHPIAVVEALALGVPVVGLATAGIGDLVEDGLVTGLPKNASAEAVAKALIGVMAGPRGDGTKSMKSTKSVKSWDATALELADVYRRVVGRRVPS